MNAERSDFDRALRTWFEEGPTVMADRVVDVIADRIARQPQRRTWRLRGRPFMNTYLKLAAGLAAVLVFAVVGYNLLPGRAGPGAPTSAPTPSAQPSPTTAATEAATCTGIVDAPNDDTTLEPCRYRFRPFEEVPNLSVVADIPEGWFNYQSWGVGIVGRGSDAPSGVTVIFSRNEHGLYSDPCHWDLDGTGTWEQEGDIEVGPSVSDLVDALRENTSYTSTTPSPVAFGPYEGQELEIQLPADLNLETCDVDEEGEPRYRPMPDTIYAQGDGNRWRMSIVDVAGTRVFPTVVYYEGTPAADLEAAEGIIDSLEFTP